MKLKMEEKYVGFSCFNYHVQLADLFTSKHSKPFSHLLILADTTITYFSVLFCSLLFQFVIT